MTSPAPSFRVPLDELEDEDHTLDVPVPVEWLERALTGTEARTRGEPGRLDVTLSKAGREVMVRGEVEVPIEMDCARSLEPFPIDLRAEVFLMLSPAAPPPRQRRAPKAAKTATAAAVEPAKGAGRSADDASNEPSRGKPGKQGGKGSRRGRDEEGVELSAEDAAQDFYEGDEVVLDGFIREFILLELPLFPLRPGVAAPIAPHPAESPGADPEIDPRLAPLAAFRARLQGQGDKE